MNSGMSSGMKSGMTIADFLRPDAVLAGWEAESKRQLLQNLAAQAAPLAGLAAQGIFETLLERERLGSTGAGHGVAIPHGKFSKLPALTGVFVTLAKPVDFESADGEPVDLVFLLLAPEDAGADHLKALARISRALSRKSTRQRLRAAKKPATLFSLLAKAG